MTDKEIQESKLIHFTNRRGIRRMVQQSTPSGYKITPSADRYACLNDKTDAKQ